MYLDGQLVQLTVNDNGTEVLMKFAYDADGVPLSITYKGTTYYYVTNLQGDVLGVVNQSGNLLLSYTYDAWGNILSVGGSNKNTMGKYNPLRYRGYVYDEGTGLYYLQSRYYDPEMGRFLNADGYTSTGAGLLGNNMYAYCNNNPVNTVDSSGNYPIEVDDNSTSRSDTLCGKLREKIIDEKEKASKREGGTITRGINLGAAFGASVFASGGIATDSQGNIGFVVTSGGGAGFPSTGVTGFVTYTSAPTIYKLNGLGSQVGGSLNIYGASLGAEYVLFADSDTTESYHGVTVFAGAELEFPIELHADIGTSKVYGINIYDAMLYVVDWVDPD